MIIAGASGLIGSELLKLLLTKDVIKEILVLTRRPLNIQHQKVKELVINFDNLADIKGQVHGDAIYFCLGTTRSKTADNQIYRKIEHDYSVALAEIGKINNVAQFHYLSALGANSNSSIFYNKIKGVTEHDLKRIGLKSLHIYQPSLLVGKRKEHRFLESLLIPLMELVNPILKGSLKKYQSIKAATVADAIVNQTLKEIEGIHIYPSDKIKELA